MVNYQQSIPPPANAHDASVLAPDAPELQVIVYAAVAGGVTYELMNTGFTFAPLTSALWAVVVGAAVLKQGAVLRIANYVLNRSLLNPNMPLSPQ